MKPVVKAVLCAAPLLLLAACAAGGPESHAAAGGGTISLLLLGFWHGVIAPVTLLVEVAHRFLPHVAPWTIRLYETKANSVFYDIGFYLGLAGAPSVAFRRWS